MLRALLAILVIQLGVNVASATILAEGRPLFLTEKQFRGLSAAQKNKYVKDLRQAFYDAEKFYLKGIPVAKGKKIYDLFVGRLYAGQWDGSSECVIGGRSSTVIDGLCSTKLPEFKCSRADSGEEGFQCGKIYGDACIDRTDIRKISELCFQAGEKNEAGVEILREARKLHDDLCVRAGKAELAGCRYLDNKLALATSSQAQNAESQISQAQAIEEIVIQPSALKAVVDRKDLQQCIDNADDKNCIVGALNVKFIKDDQGKEKAHLLTCERNWFEKQRSNNVPSDFADFLEANQSHAVVKDFVSNMTLKDDEGKTVKASLGDYILFLHKYKNSTLSFSDTKGAEALMKLANFYNSSKEHAKCDDIADYRMKNIPEEKMHKAYASDLVLYSKQNTDRLADIEKACTERTTAQLNRKAPQAVRIDYEKDGGTESLWMFPMQGKSSGGELPEYTITYRVGGQEKTLKVKRNQIYNSNDISLILDDKTYKIKAMNHVHPSKVNDTAPNVAATEETYCASFVRAPASNVTPVVPASTDQGNH